MTAQVPDTIHLDGQEFTLAGISGGELFDPYAHGLEPEMANTACWRGFECEYLVRDDRLLLNTLSIYLKQPAVAVLGIEPEAVVDSHDYTTIYRNMKSPMAFTGGLLAADDFIEELYVHMGFHPVWKYREVRELLVDGGVVTAIRDCTEQVAEMRQRLADEPLEPGSESEREDLVSWIEQTFSRDYGW